MVWQIMQMNWQYNINSGLRKKACNTMLVLFLTVTAFGQQRLFYTDKRKGQLILTWGWNRAAYTKCNISFKGSDYNFKLYNVAAHDSPSLPITFQGYLKFRNLT